MSPPRALWALPLSAAVLSWLRARRRSVAVQRWRPPTRRPVAGSRLACTIAGAGDPTTVLLHGMTEAGNCFGAAFDRLPGTVVVPDLLGFGDSRDVDPGGIAAPGPPYGRAHHVAAVVGLLDDLGVSDGPLLLAGHSAGAILAMHVAAALPVPPLGVVALAAPLFLDPAEARARVRGASWAGDLAWARWLCDLVCSRPRVGAAAWTLLGPQWPGPVARAGARHTWDSHVRTLEELVVDSRWESAVATTGERGVPVSLLEGAEERMLVPGRAATVAAAHDHVECPPPVERAGHALPLESPAVCVIHIRERLGEWATRTGPEPIAGGRPTR